MEGLSVNFITTSTTTSICSSSSSSSSSHSSSSSSYSFINPICTRLRIKRVTLSKCKTNKYKFAIFASQKDDPKLDPLDQMELQFGRLLGEDPKLTIAKIMARKANPEANYLEVEKSYNKNKGKNTIIEGLPIDWSKDGINLTRPVPKNGFEFKTNDAISKPSLSLIQRPSHPGKKASEGVTRSVPNVILRKPSLVNEPDVSDKPSRVRLRRNLSLAMMGNPVKEEFSDMTLLRKPDPVIVDKSSASSDMEEKIEFEANDYTLLRKPEALVAESEVSSEDSLSIEKPRLQPQDPSVTSSIDDEIEKGIPHSGPDFSNANSFVEAALVGKPKRLDQLVQVQADSLSVKKPKRLDQLVQVQADSLSVKKPAEFEDLQVGLDIKELEEADWDRAEALFKTGNKGEIELISCSARGFAVSFGSLIGFLPYRNLSSKWKFLAVESWLRREGLDPAKYRQNLGIIGNHEAANNTYVTHSSVDKKDIKVKRKVSADMKLEELLQIYDQEKTKFLSSFVGQRLKANVVLANRISGKLLFSVKPKEREELIAKKRNLMAKLQLGEIVKCCITKITYFGIFVEIDGVPALIHQTEVSWDATLDPSAYFKVGQIVEAKVHQLDFALDRIFLSLKEIIPDPLVDALEAVIGDRNPMDTRLQAAETDTEWEDVESLIKELQQTEGIESVSKGRFFFSPGLAPTFQVYMASMFENRYKLLARSGNKVQEVIVETSLDKEELKSSILTCTNRVE